MSKVEGEPAHTREVNVSCVFTKIAADTDGHPAPDLASTSYVGVIESGEQCGLQLHSEA
jgi:hypothetical protein